MNMPDRIYHGEYNIPIVKVFVDNNLDIKDFLCGVFQGNKSVFACLAVHLDVGWKDSKVLKALYDIFHTNANAILDQILQAQQMNNLPDLKSRLAAAKYSGSFTYKDSSPSLSTLSPTKLLKPTYEDEIIKVDSRQSLLKQSKSLNSSKELKETYPIISQHFVDEVQNIHQSELFEPTSKEKVDKNRSLLKQNKSLNSHQELKKPLSVIPQHFANEVHYVYQNERLEPTYDYKVDRIQPSLKPNKSLNSHQELYNPRPVVPQHFANEVQHIYQNEQLEPTYDDKVDRIQPSLKPNKSLNSHQELNKPRPVVPQHFSNEVQHIYQNERLEPTYDDNVDRMQTSLKQQRSTNSYHHIYQSEPIGLTNEDTPEKNQPILKQQKSLTSFQGPKQSRPVVSQHFANEVHQIYQSEQFEPATEDKVEKNLPFMKQNKSLISHREFKDPDPVDSQGFSDEKHNIYHGERFYFIKRFLENNCKTFEDLTIEKYLPKTHLKYKVDLSRSSDFTKPLIERSNREIDLSVKVISESKNLIKRCLTILERNRKVFENLSQVEEI